MKYLKKKNTFKGLWIYLKEIFKKYKFEGLQIFIKKIQNPCLWISFKYPFKNILKVHV